MVQLVRMNEKEFEQFIQIAVDDYARQQVAAGAWQQQNAVELSRHAFNSLLPKGLASPDQFLNLLIREEDNEQVGYVWFGILEEDDNRFVVLFDIIIFEQYRRLGYGREAMIAMEKIVKELGIKSIALHVFGNNMGARALYKELGYLERNITMVKELNE